MGILLCEQNFRDVWRRNKSVRGEIGKNLRTHKHTHAAKLVVRVCTDSLRHGNGLSALLLLTRAAKSSAAKSSAAKTRSIESRLSLLLI